MKEIIGIVLLAALVIALVALGPLLLMWGLDFMGFPVTYDLSTWFGAFLIQAFIGTAVSASVKANNK